jgi:hypothetical protein
MNWLPLVAYFFGGLFAANAVPHLVSGSTGHAFQSPFAKPSGQGLSSSTVNVLWGFLNAVIAYLLVAHVGDFHPRSWVYMGVFFLGALLRQQHQQSHAAFHGTSHARQGDGPVAESSAL